MISDDLTRTEPCATCPYRKSAPRALWHRSEFENLAQQDANEFSGHTFGCHSDKKKPEQEFCVGWLLDQLRRGVPSIQLRFSLMKRPKVVNNLDALEDNLDAYYESIAAMCRANGVRLRRSR
jgi:hypothetical protein